MNESIQRSGDPLDRDGVLETDPAKEESHGVVVEVQEAQGGLAEHNKDSVQELIELGEEENIEPEVEGALAGRNALVIADEAIQAVVLVWEGKKEVEGGRGQE